MAIHYASLHGRAMKLRGRAPSHRLKSQHCDATVTTPQYSHCQLSPFWCEGKKKSSRAAVFLRAGGFPWACMRRNSGRARTPWLSRGARDSSQPRHRRSRALRRVCTSVLCAFDGPELNRAGVVCCTLSVARGCLRRLTPPLLRGQAHTTLTLSLIHI